MDIDGEVNRPPAGGYNICYRARRRNERARTRQPFKPTAARLIYLQRDGSSYLSNATLGGRFALRGCVLNYRTTLRDMEILLDDLRRVATRRRKKE